MTLLAISDLHVGYEQNKTALAQIGHHGDDWLILAGDIGESCAHIERTLDALLPKFRQLLWVPGNHELWTRREEPGLAGVSKYEALVAACRSRGVLTPEDPFPLYFGEDGTRRIALLFTLYDYSFTPTPMAPEEALQWAIDQGVLCSDEAVLRADPYPSRAAWCSARCEETERRLTQARSLDDHPLVLVNHFPMRREHVVMPRYPAFSIWCGTERTRDWASRFGATDVVYGHLHIPGTRLEGDVRYHEVSFGYPGQWSGGMERSLRVIAR